MLTDFFDDGHVPVRGFTRSRGRTADGSMTIPQGTVLRRIYIRNNTANAVTGGIKIGTTAAGTDVLAAGAVGANAVMTFAPLIGAYKGDGARTLYVEDVSAWNSANIDVALEWEKIDD